MVETHLISFLTYPNIAGFKPGPDVVIAKHPLFRILHMWFNVNREPVSDIRLRRAIGHAIDTTEINKIAFAGQDIPLQTVYTPTSPFFNPDAKKPEYDPRKAEALLDELGYRKGSDGVRLRIKFTEVVGFGQEPANQVVKDQLSRVGVVLDFESMEWTPYFDKAYVKKDVVMGVGAAFHGPDFGELAGYWKGGGFRSVGYSNLRANELFDKISGVRDANERRNMYFEIQRLVAEDMPRISLTENQRFQVVKKSYHGWWWEPEVVDKAAYRDVRFVWWEGGKPPAPTTPPPTLIQTLTVTQTVPTTVTVTTTVATVKTVQVVPETTNFLLYGLIAATIGLLIAVVYIYAVKRRT